VNIVYPKCQGYLKNRFGTSTWGSELIIRLLNLYSINSKTITNTSGEIRQAEWKNKLVNSLSLDRTNIQKMLIWEFSNSISKRKELRNIHFGCNWLAGWLPSAWAENKCFLSWFLGYLRWILDVQEVLPHTRFSPNLAPISGHSERRKHGTREQN